MRARCFLMDWRPTLSAFPTSDLDTEDTRKRFKLLQCKVQTEPVLEHKKRLPESSAKVYWKIKLQPIIDNIHKLQYIHNSF